MNNQNEQFPTPKHLATAEQLEQTWESTLDALEGNPDSIVIQASLEQDPAKLAAFIEESKDTLSAEGTAFLKASLAVKEQLGHIQRDEPSDGWVEAWDAMREAVDSEELSAVEQVSLFQDPDQLAQWLEHNEQYLSPESVAFLKASEAAKRAKLKAE